MLSNRSLNMYYITIFTMLLSITFCVKKAPLTLENSTSKESTTTFTDDMPILDNNLPNVSSQEIDQMIADLIDFKLGDTVLLDSPKKFLQISILFTLAQSSNYYTISQKKNTDDDEVNTYMNKKREEFYKTLKISEAEYIEYGIAHSEEVQEFLATNESLTQLYEIIQSQVTD